MSIAGVPIGAVSLSIQMLNGCITVRSYLVDFVLCSSNEGYKLFEACVGMPDDFQYLPTSFLLERGRLSSWEKAVETIPMKLRSV